MAGRGRGARRGCARGPGPRAGDGQKDSRFAGEEGLADTPQRVALPIAVVSISAAIAAARTVAETGCHRRRRSAVHSSAPTTGQGRRGRKDTCVVASASTTRPPDLDGRIAAGADRPPAPPHPLCSSPAPTRLPEGRGRGKGGPRRRRGRRCGASGEGRADNDVTGARTPRREILETCRRVPVPPAPGEGASAGARRFVHCCCGPESRA